MDETGEEEKLQRWQINPAALVVLQQVYAMEPFPTTEVRKQLAAKLRVHPRQVQTWFQNRRARERRMGGEVVRPPSHAAGGGGHGGGGFGPGGAGPSGAGPGPSSWRDSSLLHAGVTPELIASMGSLPPAASSLGLPLPPFSSVALRGDGSGVGSLAAQLRAAAAMQGAGIGGLSGAMQGAGGGLGGAFGGGGGLGGLGGGLEGPLSGLPPHLAQGSLPGGLGGLGGGGGGGLGPGGIAAMQGVAGGGGLGSAASTLLGGVLNVGPFGLIPSLPAVGSGTNLAEGFAQACGEDLGGEGVPEEGQRPNPNPGTLPGPLLRLLVSAKPPFTLLTASQPWLDATSFTLEEVHRRKRSFEELLAPPHDGPERIALLRAMVAGRPACVTLDVCSRFGAPFTQRIDLEPLTDASGVVRCLHLVSTVVVPKHDLAIGETPSQADAFADEEMDGEGSDGYASATTTSTRRTSPGQQVSPQHSAGAHGGGGEGTSMLTDKNALLEAFLDF